MKIVKRLLCFGAAIAMVLSIAMMTSCNNVYIIPNDKYIEFPIEKNVTLTWWYDYSDDYFTGDFTALEDHPYMVERQKASNVTIEFVEPTDSSKAQSELMALMASNEMCDMVTHNWYKPEYEGTTIDSVIDEEIYLRLNDFVDVQMPNYTAMREQYIIIDKIALTQQNNIIWIPKINHMEDYDREKLTSGLVVRKDYLDEIQFVSEDGGSLPVTMRDWERMLEGFYSYGIQCPLAKNMNLWVTFTGDVFLSSWNVKVETYRDPETGKAAYGAISDEFKSYVETMRDWVERGLLVSVDPTAENKIADKYVGSWYGNADEIVNLKNQAEGVANFELVGVPDPVQNVGDKIVMRDSYRPVGCASLDSVFISATCVNGPLACRWLDEFFTEESYYRTSYGVEGTDYTKAEDGTITFTSKITDNADGIRYGIAQNAFLDSFYCDPYVVLNYAYTPEQLAAVAEWSKSSCEFSFIDRLCLSYTDEELEVLAVTDSIGWQVALQTNGFVTGSKSMEEWEDYVANINEIGIDEYVGVMQSAWDRFLAS